MVRPAPTATTTAGDAHRLLARLLGGPVESAASFEDHPDPGLFPVEAERIARAVPRRRREFATVRRCARTALGRLGVPPAPILPGPRGAPGWPEGVVGTMTHCAGFRGAAVAHARDVAAVGIDAEPNEALPSDGVRELVTRPEERDRLAAWSAHRPDVHGDRLLFCAKETVFKCWYPLTGRELDFGEAEVTLDPAGTFTARLLVPGPVVDGTVQRTWDGRWVAEGGLLVAAITVPRRAERAAAGPSRAPGSGA